MGQYALIISERGAGFTVTAISDAIAKQGIEVRSVPINTPQIVDYVRTALCIVVADYCGDEITQYQIWHLCTELEKHIALYGTSDEVAELRQVFKEGNLCKVFVRPVEMKEISDWVEKVQKESIEKTQKKKVLVVDDSGMMLRTVMGWLESKYNVSLANSAASAFRSIDKNKPDLILLDYEMPVCSGAQFMEMLAADSDYAEIPVIFLTSRSDAQTVREVMQLKPKGYILKSSPQDQLIKSIDDFFKSVEKAI